MIAILSDIHGNLYALNAVIDDLTRQSIEGIIFLGDLIDYGQQSNEVIEVISTLHIPIVCNLWGNHEDAIMRKDFAKFSSERGKNSARYTSGTLSERTKNYLETNCVKSGFKKIELCGKKCLAIHGSMEDIFWTGIIPENLHGNYQDYDVVFSGHTHYAHCFTKFYATNNLSMRNKKAVTFINPGSVGQPRNQNPNAQYAIVDTENWSVYLRAVKYDIAAAMNLFCGQVDDFYKMRLEKGV